MVQRLGVIIRLVLRDLLLLLLLLLDLLTLRFTEKILQIGNDRIRSSRVVSPGALNSLLDLMQRSI